MAFRHELLVFCIVCNVLFTRKIQKKLKKT